MNWSKLQIKRKGSTNKNKDNLFHNLRDKTTKLQDLDRLRKQEKNLKTYDLRLTSFMRIRQLTRIPMKSISRKSKQMLIC